MKKLMLLLAVLALGTFASAQTFGFASLGGGLYCNYEQLVNYGGGAWAGYDNLSACGASVNATIMGIQSTVPNVGLPTGGPGIVYGDSIYAVYNGDPFAQWTVFTKTKCNKQDRFGHYLGSLGWVGLAGFSGFYAGSNEGYLSCAIPGHKGVTPTKGASTVAK